MPGQAYLRKSENHTCHVYRKRARLQRQTLFLSKVREEQDSDLLKSLHYGQHINKNDEAKFFVFIKIDKELPMVGAGN
jgi:hypothetical protein